MEDPYSSPQSNIEKPDTYSMGTNIEKGIAGEYQINIGGIIQEAWSLVDGAKLQFFLYFLIYLGVTILLSTAMSFVGLSGNKEIQAGNYLIGMAISLGSNFLTLPITMPLMAGFIYMGIRRALGLSFGVSEGLSCFSLFLPLLILGLLMNIITYIGYILLIIPGIYLSLAYILAIPLVVERKMGAWEALETSRKAITHNWFSVFGLTLLLSLIMLISMIPLGIGMIWTGPLMAIAIGVLYKTVFGIETKAE